MVYSRKQQENEWVDVAQEAQEEGFSTPSHPPPPKGSWRQRFGAWFMGMFYELVQDFSGDPLPEDMIEQEEEQLAVKK